MRKLTAATRWLGVALTAGLMTAAVPGMTSAASADRAASTPSPTPAAASGGGWYHLVNQGSGKCVDARGGNSANGTVIQQYVCNGTASQDFQLVPTGDGYDQIAVRLAPYPVLDVTDASLINSAPVQLWSYAGGVNQQWQAVPQGGGNYHFVVRHSGRCLDVPGASTDNAVQLQQYTCNGTVAQSFAMVPAGTSDSVDPNAWYNLVNRGSNRCVDARGGNAANGAVVQQYTCNGTASQSFQFVPTGDGYYVIVVRLVPNPVLDVTNGSTANGALIQLWRYAGGSNQQWQTVSEGGGNYHFVARHSGRCLDVPGATSNNAVQLWQYGCNNSLAQSFSLVP